MKRQYTYLLVLDSHSFPSAYLHTGHIDPSSHSETNASPRFMTQFIGPKGYDNKIHFICWYLVHYEKTVTIKLLSHLVATSYCHDQAAVTFGCYFLLS